MLLELILDPSAIMAVATECMQKAMDYTAVCLAHQVDTRDHVGHDALSRQTNHDTTDPPNSQEGLDVDPQHLQGGQDPPQNEHPGS